MNCAICREEFVDNDRLVFNKKETFVFKPADVPDPEVFDEKGHRINLAATRSPDELRELRKEHQRTTVATVFHLFGKAEIPEGAFNVRHDYCGVQTTGTTGMGAHPLFKHQIRYRQLQRRGVHY